MIIDNAEITRLIGAPERRNEGLSLLVEAFTEPLYWHLRRLLVVHEDAEDVLQESWIKIFASIDSFRGGGEGLKAWCYRVATNTALDKLRRRCRWRMVTLENVGGELMQSLTHEVGESAESIEVRFQRALLSLPTKQRLVFNLRYYDELSYREIGQITGISEASCKTNYHYAQQRIKEEMTL